MDWSVTTEILAPCGTVPPACASAGNTRAGTRNRDAKRVREFITVTSDMD
jgi:hypothetical protein